MLEKELDFDIRSFDPVYGTVTFDIKVHREKNLGEQIGTLYPEKDGSAIVTVSSQIDGHELSEQDKIWSSTKIVWYKVNKRDDERDYDKEDDLKEMLCRTAYYLIMSVRRNKQ